MESLVLKDKTVIPDDNLIFSIIGNNKIHWLRLLQTIHLRYPDSQDVWNYYNDGKNWLFRIIRRKKTLFWIGILKDTFRITFYFGDKAWPAIENSSLPASMKEDFRNGKKYGKIRALSIRVNQDEDIDHAVLLAEIRAGLK